MGVSVTTFLTVLGLVPVALGTPMVAGNVATNELVESPIQEDSDAPYCRVGSACGYLQVNAYGVNKVQFCRCPRRLGTCGLHWDPQDGRSITMASQQYKFCGSRPPVHVCDRDETAYTAAYIYNKATFSTVHRILCYCPPPLVHFHSDMVENMVDGEHVMATVHSCSRLPPCEEDTPCKEVSIGSNTSLVKRTCRCPRDTSCPTLGTRVTPHSNSYLEGSAYSVYCQRQY